MPASLPGRSTKRREGPPGGPRGSADPVRDLRRQQNALVRGSWPRTGPAWGASLLDSPQPGRQQRMSAARVPQAPYSFAGLERRTFLGAITVGLLAAPLAVDGQQAGKVHRIGWI